ncbi:MAG: hypothetical protein JOY71_19465 [Acetobacteraceae bacterium]|nr:hypothetical protein [Acetobacteraceae bacterium]MBV8524274.1 hypothetical protein [Acetobacteraceae bacterium]
MKALLIPAALALVIGAGVTEAHARGCIKGAAVGGVAGHYAGHHGVLGAAAGCAVGHHEANKAQHQSTTQNQQSQPNPSTGNTQ